VHGPWIENQLSLYIIKRPPLWSSGQSSYLHIQRSGFDSRSYQNSWEVIGQERGPLSLVNTIEKILERKSSGSGLENSEYGLRDPSRWPCDTPLSIKFGTNFPDKRRLLGRHRSLADQSHGVIIIIIIIIILICTFRKKRWFNEELGWSHVVVAVGNLRHYCEISWRWRGNYLTSPLRKRTGGRRHKTPNRTEWQ
jgi:hypothetical protein